MSNRNATHLLRVALIASAMAAFGTGAPAQTYTIVDVGTLRGGSARVHAINTSGDVVGRSGDPHGSESRAFFWSPAGIRDVGALPGSDYAEAFGLNDSGQIVGSSNTSSSVHAFLSGAGGGLTDLGTLPGTNASRAYAINNLGHVAGASGTHAVVWSPGIQDLGVLAGGDWAEARSISNNDQVVGKSNSSAGNRAFLWSSGSGLKAVGTLPGDDASWANHINDTGVVVGASEGSGGVRAFVWTANSGMQTLNALAGGTYSEAMWVNNAGQIVGVSGSSLGTRAVMWKPDGSVVDLNDVVGNPLIVLTGAFAVNDSGQIAAYGVLQPGTGPHQQVDLDHIHAGPTHVFVLTPH